MEEQKCVKMSVYADEIVLAIIIIMCSTAVSVAHVFGPYPHSHYHSSWLQQANSGYISSSCVSNVHAPIAYVWFVFN